MCAGPSRIASILFVSADEANAFVLAARDKARWLDPHTKEEASLSVRGDKTRPEQAVGKANSPVYNRLNVDLIQAGWKSSEFRLSFKRNTSFLEDLRTTLVYEMVKYELDSSGRVFHVINTESMHAVGIRHIAPIKAAADQGILLANAFIIGGI